jgi:hypothetical protein
MSLIDETAVYGTVTAEAILMLEKQSVFFSLFW